MSGVGRALPGVTMGRGVIGGVCSMARGPSNTMARTQPTYQQLSEANEWLRSELDRVTRAFDLLLSTRDQNKSLSWKLANDLSAQLQEANRTIGRLDAENQSLRGMLDRVDDDPSLRARCAQDGASESMRVWTEAPFPARALRHGV